MHTACMIIPAISTRTSTNSLQLKLRPYVLSSYCTCTLLVHTVHTYSYMASNGQPIYVSLLYFCFFTLCDIFRFVILYYTAMMRYWWCLWWISLILYSIGHYYNGDLFIIFQYKKTLLLWITHFFFPTHFTHYVLTHNSYTAAGSTVAISSLPL